MNFDFDVRPSDSPLVETIWRTYNQNAGKFTSVAVSRWEIVITQQRGKITVGVRGPETLATPALVPDDADILGIQFKLGTFMPHLPTVNLVDSAIVLPEAGSQQRVWLHGAAWEIPNFENADEFLARLVRQGLLVHDPVVDAVLQNQRIEFSKRTVERRFLRATGLTHGTLNQIERARQSATLLEQGLPIADAVFQGGYADQPHLTRSLKRFVGVTPAQVLDAVNNLP